MFRGTVYKLKHDNFFSVGQDVERLMSIYTATEGKDISQIMSYSGCTRRALDHDFGISSFLTRIL